MKKLFILMLLVFSLTLSLFACAENKKDDIFEELMRPTDESESEIVPFATKVYLIIPEKSSGNLATRAESLADNINKKTGVEVYLKYDNETTVVADGELEILVGYTSRLASNEAMKQLKFEDYICKWDRDSILLGGRYEDATVAAIEAFEEKVLHGASKASLMGKDVKLENINNYEVGSVKLNGYDLYDFTITYSDKSSSGEYEMAHNLRAYIASKSGYWLSVISDKSVNGTVGKVISISESSEILYDALCESRDGSVFVSGKDSYALSEAVADFSERLLNVDEGGNATLSIDEKLIYNCTQESIGISAAFAEYSDKPSLEQIYDINAHIRTGNDIIVFGKTTSALADYIVQNRIEGYEYITVDLDAEHKLPIVYREAKAVNVGYELSDNILRISFNSVGSTDKYVLLYALAESDTAKISDILHSEKYEILILSDAQFDFANENMIFLGDTEWKLGTASHSFKFLIDTALSQSGAPITEQKGEGSTYLSVFSSFKVEKKYSDKYTALCKTLQ